ncbi:MAG TPA: DUF4129 domain-containing protein [Streptosporangiaceae bacterium]|jgi:hypothetical protein|nr:DUF4129 domain-containing protein [Streptosporangiaceae bacterium]
MTAPRLVGRLADPIGRDEARELARRELDKQIYHRDDPSIADRVLEKINEWIESLTRTISGAEQQDSVGGWIALAVILVLLGFVAVAIMWRLGAVRGAATRRRALLADEPMSADDHRAAAAGHEAAGQWAEAIRERLRAVARDLEERVILEPRPGRTADELAAEAGAALPELAAELAAGVRVFDEIWYGDRPGTPEGYTQLTRLDERVRAAKPRPIESRTPSSRPPESRPMEPAS